MSYHGRNNQRGDGWGRQNSYNYPDDRGRNNNRNFGRDDRYRGDQYSKYRPGGDNGGHRWNERDYNERYGSGYSESYGRGRDDNHYGDRAQYEQSQDRNNINMGAASYPSAGSYSKRPNPNLHNGASLTAQERKVKAKMIESGSSVNYLSKQAFTRPEGWDEKVNKAIESTIKHVKDEMEKKEEKEKAEESDPDSDEYTPVGVDLGAASRHEREAVAKFIRKLADFPSMTNGFHVDCLTREDTNKICICPCSKDGLEEVDGDAVCKNFKVGTPNSLMDHLKKEGGLFEEKKDRKKVLVPLTCPYHYAARTFLRELYKGYHGIINGKEIDHEALHPPGCEEWRLARSAADRKKEREKQVVVKENQRLKSRVDKVEKKLLDLSKINQVLYDKMKRVESEMQKLGVVKKDKHQLTDSEIQEYRDDLRGQFDLLRYLVCQGNKFETLIEPVKIYVKPDNRANSSFNLQELLDCVYDGKYEDSAFSNKTGFDKCRELFFGDVLTISEAADLKEDRKKKKPTNNITMGLISDFNVIYTKNEQCGSAKAEEHTAVDEGGPSRQFINDVFLQIQTLSVSVGGEGKPITIFGQDTAGRDRENVIELIPRTDVELERKVKAVARHGRQERDSPEIRVLVDETMTRIMLYSRFMGRMLLHAFICGHPVSTACMTPFFMNLLLRGVMPGNERYEQCDVVRDMDGILISNANKNISYMLEDGETDDNGNPWTPETIFSHRIPKEFIHTRSIILGGIIDGLSLRGKRDLSQSISKGSELCHMLRNVPIEAISKILFARPNLSFDDVHSALVPAYNENPDENETADYLASYRAQQEVFYETVFLPYIRAQAENDSTFLSKFVECCTGSSCLPYVPAGDCSFQIKVEFNLQEKEALAFPRFHTCTKELVFPAHVYIRGADDFKKMMDEVIELCRAKFEMQ